MVVEQNETRLENTCGVQHKAKREREREREQLGIMTARTIPLIAPCG